MPRCRTCLTDYVVVVFDGTEVYKCPECDDLDHNPLTDTHICRGCWMDKACLAHHVSYNPEKVVPVCNDCHALLHARDGFLPNLQPDMSRGEADDRGLVSIIGLDSVEEFKQ